VALTTKEIENAKPMAKKYKMADGGGLCLLVARQGRSSGYGAIDSMVRKRICISVSTRASP
jgi:hypothetical protein